ncbi:MAG TPA: hypothetical protein VD886_10745 [Herpetosiphonaceae bacterium]|nr:hypothetical protein [Herpetosiphonaceae bacterium]
MTKLRELKQRFSELEWDWDSGRAEEAWYMINDALRRCRKPERLEILRWAVLAYPASYDNEPRIWAGLVVLRESARELPELLGHLVASRDYDDRKTAVQLVRAIQAEPYVAEPHAYDHLILPLLADETWLSIDVVLALWESHPAEARAALEQLLRGPSAAYLREWLEKAGRDPAELGLIA